MNKSSNLNLWGFLSEVRSFFVPAKYTIKVSQNRVVSSAVVIPTYQPTSLTYNLIKSITNWHPNTLIVLVDDASPLVGKTQNTISKIKQLARTNAQVIYLRTPAGALKAGALNFGIDYLLGKDQKPTVVMAFDDDVRINAATIPTLIKALYARPQTGAVCSQALVRNKNHNLWTRLQSLEYHQFNITKIADNNFLYGPLVMQGMLTAFRMSALRQTGGFAQNHLIEDYDMTARLKKAGWRVRIAADAKAWTVVPTSFEALWKQRVRWSYGGLQVVRTFWRLPRAVFQDMLGHVLFITLGIMVALSFLTEGDQAVHLGWQLALIVLAGLNFALSVIFGTLTMINYPKKDKRDWALKLSVLPEFIYSNILSFILIGAYLFFIYNYVGRLASAKIDQFNSAYRLGTALFSRLGYSTTWGTKTINSQEGGLV